MTNNFIRVEELAATYAVSTELAPLRASIKALQHASIKHDHEKRKAELLLRHLLRHSQKKGGFKKGIHRAIGHACHKLKKIFGKHGEEANTELAPPMHAANAEIRRKGSFRKPVKPRIGRLPAWIKEKQERERKVDEEQAEFRIFDAEVDVDAEHPRLPHLPHIPHLPDLPKPHWPPHHKGPSRRFLRAVKHIQKINQKLAAFERGFIHEDGIKDREWYRHLGVAPGKWLGA